MATLNRLLLLISGILLFFIELGNCLQCYHCSSAREDICDDVFSHHAYHTVPVVNCESSPTLRIPGAGPNIYCGKSKDPHASPSDYVFRGCVPDNFCRLIKSRNVTDCEICETDNCNSSFKVLPSIVTSVATVFVVLAFTYMH